ncbi:nucleotide sugar dehydrogenase [Roseibium sp. SCP14]|uniref:nucleotide sugar dehydrogenase n=1 Tax=Roseibium sp. SCP14 TaxID=3141375 RepID=UPI00333A1A2C
MPVNELIDRIEKRDFSIGIVGLGYVGLPLAITAVQEGFTVIGFDINDDRVKMLNDGKSGIEHIDDAAIRDALDNKRFRATSDFTELGEPDAILIAVPTPLSKQREPDLSFIEKSAHSIAETLRPGQLVVLESTTWPGTTNEVVKPILERTGLQQGSDFFLAFSPEREDPGNAQFDTKAIPKVVGADDENSLDIVQALYGALVQQIVPVSSAKTAEAVKLTENIFRSVNIALVNELKVIYEKMDVDVWEVIDAAKSKPFGFMPFYPGPGLGGHCIPIDPFYLSWKAKEFEVATRFIELAGEINTNMPQHVLERLAWALDTRFSRGLNGAKILIVGMAYKKNVDDIRESPSLKLIELLQSRGSQIDYHDPHVPEIGSTRAYPHLQGYQSQNLSTSKLRSYDAVIISTDHDCIDWGLIAESAQLIVDTRNVCARYGQTGQNIIKA